MAWGPIEKYICSPFSLRLRAIPVSYIIFDISVLWILYICFYSMICRLCTCRLLWNMRWRSVTLFGSNMKNISPDWKNLKTYVKIQVVSFTLRVASKNENRLSMLLGYAYSQYHYPISVLDLHENLVFVTENAIRLSKSVKSIAEEGTPPQQVMNLLFWPIFCSVLVSQALAWFRSADSCIALLLAGFLWLWEVCVQEERSMIVHTIPAICL